jgi:DNA-binding LacI/PurR family transcriptional regulator/C4-dicarboxylate-specific signal transduction histidine kinase
LLVAGRALQSPDLANRTHNDVYRLIHADCVDGVILLAGGLATFAGVDAVRRLCESYRSLPICSVGLQVPDVTSILIDNRSGMDALIEHLIAIHGCRRLAFLAGPTQNPDAEQRLDVYRSVLGRHAIELDPQLIVEGNTIIDYFSARMGQRSMGVLLERGVRFDAVIAANDSMALGALEVLRARGIRVPRDVLLTGFDDVVQARIANPPLTTVRQPLERMAALAVQQVMEQMEGGEVPACFDMPGEFVPRASCGCANPALNTPVLVADTGRGSPAEVVSKREASLSALLASVLAGPRGPALGAASRLVEGLRSELSGDQEAFLATLEKLLDEVGDRNDLYEQFQVAITLLRNELRILSSPELETLWHDARRLIAVKNTQEQARQRMELEAAYVALLSCAERCSTVLDLPSLRRALMQELPKMEIANALVARYPDDQRRELESVLCLRDGDAYEPPVARYRATDLRPPGADSAVRRQTAFVLPLAAENESLGVAVLEFGPRIAAHEMLREQISTAIKQCSLHAERVRKTLLHQRSTEERQAAAERMRSLSVLAGGIAHDLNNALGPLVALPELILSELAQFEACRVPNAAEIRTDLDTVRSASLRAAQTIQDLLTLGRQGHAQKQLLELNQLVAACWDAERDRGTQTEQRSIAVTVELCPAPLLIHGSEPDLRRALANLIRNAIEAIAETGQVVIRTGSVSLSQPLSGHESIDAGEYAITTIEDTGRGFDGLELRRVFEPFFTRRRFLSTSGSGLGLAIVYGVVKEHDGFVDVQSSLGRGTTFSLYFPVRDPTPTSAHDPTAFPARGGRQ